MVTAATDCSSRPKSSSGQLFWKQLTALLWKGLITRRRHYVESFFEVIGPLLLPFFILNGIDSMQSGDNASKGNFVLEPPIPFGLLPNMTITFERSDFYLNNSKILKVFYSPKSDETDLLVASMQNSSVQVIGLKDEDAIREKLSDLGNGTANVSMLGLVFGDINFEKPGSLSYNLLLTNCSETLQLAMSQEYIQKFTQAPSTFNYEEYRQAIYVMSYVNREYLHRCCPNGVANCIGERELLRQVHIARMPYPEYRDSMDIPLFQMLGFVIVLGYVLMVPLIVKRITGEKSSKMKELLRMMGMHDLVFWTAHFLNYYLVTVLHMLLFVFLLFFFTSNGVFGTSSITPVAVFFLLYGAQMILFAMLLSTVFNRPVLAVIVTVILWFIAASLTFQKLVLPMCKCDAAGKNLARRVTSFLPTGSLIWLFSLGGDLENRKLGLTWANIGRTGLTDYKDFTLSEVMLLMLASCLLFAFFIFYLDNVWPFQNGVPKSPFFLFQKSYWSPEACQTARRNPSSLDSKINEAEPENLAPRIEIQDVCKSFKLKSAVDHLWLNIYENQLTVLLGHNGAGKTTTMNMITGMYASTSGTIYVNSFNVFAQTAEARRSIGLCPQENIYFSELTVGQHLALFAQLKDFPKNLIYKEVNYVLDQLALLDKKNVLADNLSGGMKRKLALGIAIVGDTDTLILDEPSSGMDPEARRIIWDMLISLRRKKTILLTTHYMEEADVLGDRIAIMNEGKLCCTGSPLFLKNAYGAGYRLRVAKLDGFKSHAFVHVLRRYIPQAGLVSEVETEVVFSLDGEKEFLLTTFPKLFDDIEKHKAQYCIESCGLSYTSLEDVFLVVGSNSDLKHKPVEQGDSENLLLSAQSDLATGLPLLCGQLKGLYLKRFHFARRYLAMFILQMLIPGLLVALAMLSKGTKKGNTSTLVLDVEKLYGKDTITFYQGDSEYFEDYKTVNEQKWHANVSHIPGEDSPQVVDDWLMGRANKSLNIYQQSYVYGLESSGDGIFTAWFNNEQFHALPLSVLTLFQTLLHPLPNSAALNISLTPFSNGTDDRSLVWKAVSLVLPWALKCLVILPMAFPFLGASYILFPIQEQASKSKLIQLITGLSPITFWLMNFVFDLLTHLLTTGILFALIALLDSDAFSNKLGHSTGGALFMLIFGYGVGTIPLAYALSYRFTTAHSGFVFLTITYLLFGFIANLNMSIANIMVIQGDADLSRHLVLYVAPIFRLMPIFSFLFGYSKVSLRNSLAELCDLPHLDVLCEAVNVTSHVKPLYTPCCPDKCTDTCIKDQNPFSVHNKMSAGVELIYLLVVGLALMAGIIIYEWYKLKITKSLSFSGRSNRNVEQSTVDPVGLDSDVEKERVRINDEVSQGKCTDLLTVHRLSKRFGQFSAVNNLSFGVRHNECFGFLGVNGAGKTTTFSMLTGDEVPTSGNAYIGNYSLMDNTTEFHKHIGYCPQFDALLDRLTGDETLYLYARLRGVLPQNMSRDIDNLVQMVGLEEHRDKLTETYSGGNKRKLSIAIALLGSPSLILLDEPSAGVDPAARRKMWQALGYVKRNMKSSVVLTSHSMEECEALCSRIAIMVNGQFQCLGATQHLRSKYGQGYSVTIRLKREYESDETGYVDRVKAQVSARIPSALLKDFHQCLMHYHVADTKETWAHIFCQLNALNEQFKFEDYFVSDTTLEQIFITFARHQQQQNKAE